MMGDVLRRRLADDPAAFARAHADWQAYWQSRSRAIPTTSRHCLVSRSCPRPGAGTRNLERESRAGSIHAEHDRAPRPAGLVDPDRDRRARAEDARGGAALICLGIELAKRPWETVRRTSAAPSPATRRRCGSTPSRTSPPTGRRRRTTWATPTGPADGGPGREPPPRHRLLRGGAAGLHRVGLLRRLGDDAEQPGQCLPEPADGGPGQNLRRAIDCYLAACGCGPSRTSPPAGRCRQFNLGLAWREILQGLMSRCGRSRPRPAGLKASATGVEADVASDQAETSRRMLGPQSAT